MERYSYYENTASDDDDPAFLQYGDYDTLDSIATNAATTPTPKELYKDLSISSKGTYSPANSTSSTATNSPNDMSALQLIPIHRDIAIAPIPPQSTTLQQQQQQLQQQQQQPQLNIHHQIMTDISQSMFSMEENMRRMQRQMEEQFRAMSMGSPMAPVMMPQIDNFGTFPRIKAPFNNNNNEDSGLLSIAGPRSPSSTAGPPSVSSLSPPSPSLSSTTTTDEPCITDRNGKKHLKMQFDMQDFKPEEVQVKKERNRLEVSALHEEKEPNRVSCRVFHQQYHLPKDVRLTKVDSKFSPDGTLTVESAVKPRHRVKFAIEDGTPQLAIEPPRSGNVGRHDNNVNIVASSYSNGVNGTPPFPINVQEPRRNKESRDRDRQSHGQTEVRFTPDARQSHGQTEVRFTPDARQSHGQTEVRFTPDARSSYGDRSRRQMTPEDDYDWPDYQSRDVRMSHDPWEDKNQHNDYKQKTKSLDRRSSNQKQKDIHQRDFHDYQPKDYPVKDYQRKDYQFKDYQMKDYPLKDYQQEDAYVNRGQNHSRGHDLRLGEGVAQVYVTNNPATYERSPERRHHDSSVYGTLTRSSPSRSPPRSSPSRSTPPKPPKRSDKRYNTLPNRKLGETHRIQDGFSSLQRPPPAYHQLSYLQQNGDVSPASSSSGSTIATAYNTYHRPHGYYHHNTSHRK